MKRIPLGRGARLLGGALAWALLGSPAGLTAQAAPPVTLTYLGVAGWKVTDGRTVVLVDPYLTRLPQAAFAGSRWTRQGAVEEAPGSAPVLYADTATLAAALPRADFILLSHCHSDHLLDAPFIARRTGARIVANENAARLVRAAGVADSQIVRVHGGEDLDFGGVSVRAIPSLHSYVGGKGYYDGRDVPENVRAPLRATDYVEGGNLAWLIRLGGRQLLVLGSGNFLEPELRGLRPDVAVVAIGGRQDTFDFTRRLLSALGEPPLVVPSHWDNFYLPATDPRAFDSEAIRAGLSAFREEVRRYAPATKVAVPRFNEPMVLPAPRPLSAR